MNTAPLISVIIPTHNPDPGRLARILGGLKAQTLPIVHWETLLVDNASTCPVETESSGNLRIVHEAQLGLTAARRRGFSEARGEFAVLVDDDNVLAPDYLATVLTLFAAHPRVGAFGGKSEPEFTITPPAWAKEFHHLLALRDLGPSPLLSAGLRDAATGRNEYPPFAPIGAGMALRRSSWAAWMQNATATSDRRGDDLTSSGDNDIVLCIMRAGWEVGYFPTLSLRHLIPASRVDEIYLARLNRGIQKSWMQVLSLHSANPWQPIATWSVPLRCAKAWFTYRAWSSPSAYIRWQGACGHFEGRRPA